MPPTVTLSDDTYTKLQSLARPFVDTPESVILALAEAELVRRSTKRSEVDQGAGQVPRLIPDDPGNLTHTRLISAKVQGQPIHRPKWNGVLDHLHVLAMERFASFDGVRKVSGANLREGRYEESGYRYLPAADLSIQGVDSNLAWDHSLRLARALVIPIELCIEWRDKEGAARPGERAVLAWEPEE